MDEFSPSPAPERPVYRDADHVILWNGSWYIVHEIHTQARRSFFDVRDALRSLNEVQSAPSTVR